MATSIGKTQCFICGKEKNTYSCKGCSKEFCFNHLNEHRQVLNKQFDEIAYHRDQFRQILIEQKQNPKQHLLFQQIVQWENDSIEKIKQTAKECRQSLTEHINKSINEIENRLNELTKQIREIRQENEFNELDLNQLKIKLIKLEEELNKPSNVLLQQNSSSFISKISVCVTNDQIYVFDKINSNTRWRQNGITVAGGNGEGNKLSQLSYPVDVYVDNNETIYIIDCGNHRIVSWKRDGKDSHIVAGGNGKGNRMDQLNEPTGMVIDKNNDSIIICDYGNRRVVRWYPEKTIQAQIIISNIKCLSLTMDKNGDIYVSDTEKDEVRRWIIGENHGTIVAGGNGNGNSLNQLNRAAAIVIDENDSLYVSDQGNHRVMKWIKGAREGIVVAGGNGQGDCLNQLSNPCRIVVGQSGEVYVVDHGNHRVMRWCKGATQGDIVVGGNGQGEKSNQFNGAVGLSFDQHGNLYVSDCGNHRIQKFQIDSN